MQAVDLAHERRRLAVLWLAVVVAPLAVVPGGFTRFVFAKLFVLAVATVLGAYLRPQGRLPRTVVVVLAVAAGICVVAALAGSTPVASLVGRWPRYEGLPVVALYVAALWLGARTVGRGVARAVQVGHAIGAMSLALLLVSLLDALGHSPMGRSDLDRSGALLGNATDQGMVAAVAALTVAGVLVHYQDRFLAASLVAALGTVALSGSRTALALTAAGLLILVAVSGRRWLVPALAALAGLAVAAVAVPATRHRLPDLSTGEARLRQWRLTLDLVADHPWLGVGPSRYVDAFGRYENAEWVRFTGADTQADSPHNLALQAAVVGGVPLLLALGALAVVVVRAARTPWTNHPECRGLLVAVAVYGVSLLGGFTAAGPTCLAAFLLGAAIAEPPPAQERAWRRHAVAAVGVIAAVAMLAACVAEIRLAEGVDQAQHGSVEDATASFESAKSLHPLDADLAMIAAQALTARADAGDPAAASPAADLAEQSLERTPDTYAALLAAGVARRGTGDLPGSLDALDRVIALFPYRADGYAQRALTRAALGDDAGARADARRARELRHG